MGVGAFVPVQEAFHVNNVANIQCTNSLVDLGIGAGQVDLYAEAVGSTVEAEGNVDVVTALLVLVADSDNGHALEYGNHVLMLDLHQYCKSDYILVQFPTC